MSEKEKGRSFLSRSRPWAKSNKDNNSPTIPSSSSSPSLQQQQFDSNNLPLPLPSTSNNQNNKSSSSKSVEISNFNNNRIGGNNSAGSYTNNTNNGYNGLGFNLEGNNEILSLVKNLVNKVSLLFFSNGFLFTFFSTFSTHFF